MTKQEFKKIIEKKIPNIESIYGLSKDKDGYLSAKIIIRGKQSHFVVYFDVNQFGVLWYGKGIVDCLKKTKFTKKLESLLSMDVEDSKKAIEKLRNKSTKLPKKSLKLENNIENFIYEIRK